MPIKSGMHGEIQISNVDSVDAPLEGVTDPRPAGTQVAHSSAGVEAEQSPAGTATEQRASPPGPVPASMADLLELARQQVDAERHLAWSEALDKDRAGLFDHERPHPPSPVALWEALRRREAEAKPPESADIRKCLDRNELGDAELLRLLTDDYRYDHARRQWLRWDGSLWAEDTTRSVQAVIMHDVASAYV